ncbi:MAG: DUF3795 domain-containing protein [Candidatus Zixiibacteriota bacterium]|nr:MAG: DUF3795 domain-containing protein [candidate division Zixibacteria bacterium]
MKKRSDTIYRALQGSCGRFCGECDIYIAYSTSDDKALSRLAGKHSKETGREISPGKLKCVGCKGQSSGCWCSGCEIRACAEDMGLEFCYQCQKYPCDPLSKLFEKYPEAQGNLKTISKIGPDAWVASMLARAKH